MTADEVEHRFPCAECGADMRYNPDQGQLVCDHCGATQAMAPILTREQARQEFSYDDALANRIPPDEIVETRFTQCNNCGAQIEFLGDNHATECPFCAAPVVTGTGTHRHLKPRGLLPFLLPEKAARAAVTRWLGRLWFAPNGLQEYARKGRKMQGIYVPYWTYDSSTHSEYSGERGVHYYVTRTRTVNGKSETYQERRTRWYPASGQVARDFDDVLVLASRSLPKRYTDNLMPWDLTALEPYAPAWLAGFQAEGYAVALDEGFVEAKQIMDQTIRQDVRADIGGDVQRIHRLDTDHDRVTFKHILLPIWLAAYKYRGRSFRFVVNARTGRVQGERPYSVWKITFAVIVGLIVAAGLAYLFSQNQ